MTFANPPAYGRGTHVRCDVCRHPDALMEPRPGSEVSFVGPDAGSDAATARAVEGYGFVRRAGRVLCGGCAAHAHAAR